MANVKLIFKGVEDCYGHELQVYANSLDCIYIEVSSEGSLSWIALDKSTAIKFAKTLRTEINKLD